MAAELYTPARLEAREYTDRVELIVHISSGKELVINRIYKSSYGFNAPDLLRNPQNED